MRKVTLLLIAFMALTNSYAQEFYFLTGQNFTKYNFDTQNELINTRLQTGSGSNYEIGYLIPFKNSFFSYSFGVTLNSYNAVSGTFANTYQWNTNYFGGQSALHYSYPLSKSFELSARAGVNLASIIYGKQTTNGVILDLTDQKEFSGGLFSIFTGIQTNYKFNDNGYLSLGYGYSRGINTSNSTQEKLSFSTNQLLFGIHFTINN